ncbi:type II secretion system F family protein [Vibrio tubiashii]|uniref:type II secretion system F family protein n=1 Tax=Vibrio tubiashii TaxID=29498 RepID=UPI001EFC5B7A|nr:type II secretion system F family protein [Vibrio tubiashii]MCG9583905.1 type II secretion system F family protein [Vibrio tubiashii]MCG9617500.1 type II secretion system F family protein [Vibrio tubiashii]MCG9685292.1 type II secretion system F family protein [Vibrio tubiashii]
MKATSNQFKQYRWKGVNQRGKLVSGSTLALSDNEVKDKLSEQSIRVKSLRRKSLSLVTRLTQRVKKKDITLLTRQLSTMLATGVPLIQALKLITLNHPKAEMKSILSYISKEVESGNPLSQSLGTASPLFDSLYTDLVATGEQSGNLAEVLQRIADYREKSQRLNAKVTKALIYPTMVMATAFAVTYLMLTMVIPQFEAMFAGFGAELPWLTQQVLALSAWLQTYSGPSLLGLMLMLGVIKLGLTKSYRFQLLFSRALLKIPLLGNILTKAAIAKFSRTLATSFNAGIPILEGIRASAKTVRNQHYHQAIKAALLDVTAGMPLYLSLRNADCFPEMVLQMIMIGEESGRLGEMLHKIADVYEFEIDNTVDNLGKIIEPTIIIFLGIVVGGLIVAMYLPIFNLMSVLG